MEISTKQYMLGIDLGTGGCKCTIVDVNGEFVNTGSKEYATYTPHLGWSEQNPNDWYDAFKVALRIAMKSSKIRGADILSIGVTAFAHTAVLLDENANVLRRAIIWNDQRSVRQVSWLRKHFGRDIFATTFQPISTTFTLPQILWIKENEPRVWDHIDTILLAKDYLRLKLTGSCLTDWTDAIGTLMFNAKKREWSEDICNRAKIPIDKLPNAVPSTDVVGYITDEASRETGLSVNTPVIAGCLDSAAENLGVGAVEPGQCLVGLGTAGRIMPIMDGPHVDPKERTFTYLHVVPGRWYSQTGTQSCGSAYKWFRDNFCNKEVIEAEAEEKSSYELMDSLAARASVGSGGLLFHPYLLGERAPYWDPSLKGDFFGITISHKKEHFIRAVLEGVAFSLRDCMDVFRELKVTIKEVRFTSGGAKSPLWRGIICDVLGVRGLIPKIIETPSLGAAMLSGMGVGLFKNSEEAVESCVKINASIEPSVKDHEKYEKLFGIYKNVHDNLSNVCRELHRIVEANNP